MRNIRAMEITGIFQRGWGKRKSLKAKWGLHKALWKKFCLATSTNQKGGTKSAGKISLWKHFLCKVVWLSYKVWSCQSLLRYFILSVLCAWNLLIISWLYLLCYTVMVNVRLEWLQQLSYFLALRFTQTIIVVYNVQCRSFVISPTF